MGGAWRGALTGDGAARREADDSPARRTKADDHGPVVWIDRTRELCGVQVGRRQPSGISGGPADGDRERSKQTFERQSTCMATPRFG